MMIDLDNATKGVGKLDSFLTAFTASFKKFWYWYLIMAFAAFVYWGSTLPEPTEEEYSQEQYSDTL